MIKTDHSTMKIEAFRFDANTYKLEVLDQTQLPSKLQYVGICGSADGFNAIKDMLVRGAPCIAAVACLSIISELNRSAEGIKTKEDLCAWLEVRKDYLASSRPTAVNLRKALDKLVDFSRSTTSPEVEYAKREVTEFCRRAIDLGRKANESLGLYGARAVLELDRVIARRPEDEQVSILTHCNTGALATVGHGTALGVIRSLHSMGKLKQAYCTETRPYNQGSRLTAWELVTEKIPATLIADSMVAYLMSSRQIDAVIVGADRVAYNGDTANKIGTLQIAVVANHFNVPFFVAAPTQSIDLVTKSASDIVIEQRPAEELRKLGSVQLAPDDVDVWNPCFDVTPANLIDGIITELGVCQPGDLCRFLTARTGKGDMRALF